MGDGKPIITLGWRATLRESVPKVKRAVKSLVGVEEAHLQEVA